MSPEYLWFLYTERFYVFPNIHLEVLRPMHVHIRVYAYVQSKDMEYIQKTGFERSRHARDGAA